MYFIRNIFRNRFLFGISNILKLSWWSTLLPILTVLQLIHQRKIPFLLCIKTKENVILPTHWANSEELCIFDYLLKSEIAIKPEVEDIQKLCISPDVNIIQNILFKGSFVGIVDSSGCYIYVYSLQTKKLEFEFIRGKMSSTISWMQFSHDNKYLVLINDKLTVHIFRLEDKLRLSQEKKSESFMSTFSQYVS